MTTNGGGDHTPLTSDDTPRSGENAEESTQAQNCTRCSELQKELQQSQKDRALYTSIKKKITLTDTLIRKYNSKCQEFDQQQKKLEDVAYKLASAKRDRKILEQQLTTTLEEVIPWKLGKEKYLKELEDCKKKLRESNDKLAGSEASCVQFKDGFYELQEKLDTLEDNQADLKKAAEKSQQAEKKASALLAKNKDDLQTTKKDLYSAKQREARLVNKHQQAKDKISELAQLLRNHGIPVPKIHKSLLGGPANVQGSASTEDTDFEHGGEVFLPPTEFLSPESHRSSIVQDHSEGDEDPGNLSVKEDACRKIFDRFSCDLSACVSPLPPSPMLSEASNHEASEDEVFSDIADQIESQFNENETGDVGDASKVSKEEETEGKKRLRQTLHRRAASRRKPRDIDAQRLDDSEEETSGMKRPSRRRRKGSKKDVTEASSPSSKLKDVVERLSESESEGSGNRHTSSHEAGGSANESDRQGRPQDEKSGIGKDSSKSSTKSRTCLEDKYRERQFSERGREELLGFSSTLSEDSDDNQEDTKNSSKEPSRRRAGNKLPVADFGSPSTAEGRHQLPPRLTRSQLKTLTEQGVIKTSDAILPSLSPCKHPKKSPAKPAVEHSGQDRKGPRMPVTRSLSFSEAESLTDAASPSPAKSACKRLLRSNSALEEEPSSEDLPVVSTQISPARSSPRQLCRSASLEEEAANNTGENPETHFEDAKPSAMEHKDDISKMFNRSVSAPAPKSSEMVIQSLEKLEDIRSRDDTSVRRVTRSQAQHLQSQDVNDAIPKQLTRSAARKSNVKTESTTLPDRMTPPRLCKKSKIDPSLVKGEDKECPKIEGQKSASESQDSNIGGAPSLLRDAESGKPEQVFESEPDKPDNAGLESKTQDQETSQICVKPRSNFNEDDHISQSTSDTKLEDTEDLEESEDSSIPLDSHRDQEVYGGQSDIEVRKDRESEPPEIEINKREADAAPENGVRSAQEEIQELPMEVVEGSQETGEKRHKLDEPQVVESGELKQGQKSRIPEKPSDSIVAEPSLSESEIRHPEGGEITRDADLSGGSGTSLEEPNDRSDDSTGDLDLEGQDDRQSFVNPERGSSSSLEGPNNKSDDSGEVVALGGLRENSQICVTLATKEANPNGDNDLGSVKDQDLESCDGHGRKIQALTETNLSNTSRGSSSTGLDLGSEGEASDEVAECPLTDDVENLRENQEARNDHSSHTSASPISRVHQEGPPNQGTSARDDRVAQHQVLCVEAESSRASTPSTDEVISINSIAGYVSPVSPLPLQDTSRPLSPLSSPSRSPPLSPLAPSPISLEGFFNLPRMLSPLPPSPGIPDLESPDNGPSALAEGIPGSGLTNQPRMISPLFPTPVPPAVSPLPEAPAASLLSPLSNASPAIPGSLEHSPMISPLRNPLIPSPCNFHAVAPSDALSVRPQHYSASRRQPASRCLAASFTSTPARMSQNPEIISPRLRSLASEMIFEFGESCPGTSGLQGPLPSLASTSSFKQKTRDNQAADSAETPKYPELQGQRSITSGFVELGNKSSAPKIDSDNSAIKKQPESNSHSVVEKEKENDQDSCEMVEEQTPKDNNTPPCDEKDSVQPKTKRRNKQSSSRKKNLTKSPHKPTSKRLAEEDPSPDSSETMKAVEKRCTRSQAACSRGLPSANSPEDRRETALRLRRKSSKAETDSESFKKTPKKRKRSSSCSEHIEKATKDSESTSKEQTDAPGIKQQTEKKEEQGSAIPTQPAMSSQPPKRGRVMLIPALELKTSGFKKSCSLRKKQVTQDNEANMLLDDPEPEVKEDIVTKPGISVTEITESLESKVSAGDEDNGEETHSICQQHGDVLESSAKQENANTPVPQPTSGQGKRACTSSSQQVTVRLGPDLVSVPRLEPLTKTPGMVEPPSAALTHPSKPKSSIGSIWGDMAARKEPGIAIFNRGPKQKKRKTKRGRDHGPSPPPVSPRKNSQVSKRVGGVDDVALSQAKGGLKGLDPTIRREAEKTTNLTTDSGMPFLIQNTELGDTPSSIQSSSVCQTSSLPHTNPTMSKLAHLDTTSALPHLGAHSQMGTAYHPQPKFGLGSVNVPHLATTNANMAASNLPVAEQCTVNTSQRTASDISESASPFLHTDPAIAVLNMTPQNEQSIATTEEKAQGLPTLQARTGLNLDNRKRHISRGSNLTCDTDEPPSPCKQAKLSPGQRLPEPRPEFKQPVSEVKPSGSKVKSKDPQQPVLSDILQQMKKLRSQTNAKPLFASILTFLGQQAISLMPVIQAKSFSKNTSTKPLLLPHEEELVVCTVESGLLSKKSNMSMLLACLCRGVQSPPPSTNVTPAIVAGAAFCRVFAALCRKIGLIDRVRIFCYDMLREAFQNVEELLLNIAVTWPTVFKKKEGSSSPILAAMEIVAMQRLVLAASPQNLQAQEIILCLSQICGWRIPEGNLPSVRCYQLVASIQDTNVTKLLNTGTPTQALTPKSYEIVKALELLAYHQGWPWTNNLLIREKLWPILKTWSQEVQAVTGSQTGSDRSKPAPTGSNQCVQSPADASACAVMKVIGDVASLGLDGHKESVCELLKMLAAVLQQPSSSVPWTVQVFTAEAVLCLSPSNPTFALEVTQRWRGQTQFAPPLRIDDKLRMLAKVARAVPSVSK